MAAGCEFNNDFNNDFAICVPSIVTTEPPVRGVPPYIVTRRRRLHPVEAAGVGFISLLATGRAALQQSLAGSALFTIESSGRASLAQAGRGALWIAFWQEAQLSAEAALAAAQPLLLIGGGLAVVIPLRYVPQQIEAEGAGYLSLLSFGEVQAELAFVGDGSWVVAAIAVGSVGWRLEGRNAIQVLANGDGSLDDEPLARALLGLPSGVLL